jgi:hypothetical protein
MRSNQLSAAEAAAVNQLIRSLRDGAGEEALAEAIEPQAADDLANAIRKFEARAAEPDDPSALTLTSQMLAAALAHGGLSADYSLAQTELDGEPVVVFLEHNIAGPRPMCEIHPVRECCQTPHDWQPIRSAGPGNAHAATTSTRDS